MMPWTRPRSRAGNQRVSTRAAFGTPCLARTEQEANDKKRREAPGSACQHCEERPPDYDASEHEARADAIAEAARWNLEDPIGNRERGGDDPDLTPGQTKLAPDGWNDLLPTKAIEVQHPREAQTASRPGCSGCEWDVRPARRSFGAIVAVGHQIGFFDVAPARLASYSADVRHSGIEMPIISLHSKDQI